MSTKAKICFLYFSLWLFALPLCGQEVTKREFNASINRLNKQIIENGEEDYNQNNKISNLNNWVGAHSRELEAANNSIKKLKEELDLKDKDRKSTTDRLWVLIAAALVFFMQAGFAVLESGLVRDHHVAGVAMKNLIDWLVVSLVFTMVGFGLMFGEGINGIIGNPFNWILDAENWGATNHKLGLEFFIFQLAFASTAATIVSGAMAERQYFFAYLLTSLLMGLVIYPIFGHWAWSGALFEGNKGWLENLGFHDFAGSTVVHTIGGAVSLAGIIVIKPRRGMFLEGDSIRVNMSWFEKLKNWLFTDRVNTDFEKPANLGMAVLGVFILWFGWWGFNGGSILAMDDTVIGTIVKTNTAGAVAGLFAFSLSFFIDGKINERRDTFAKTLGGVLGGLVAVTASCDIISISQSIYVGLGAGLLHNLAYDLMLKKRLDDPVGVVPVHLVCGVWGTFFVGFVNGKWGAQLIGIGSAILFAFIVAFLFFKLLEHTNNLHVPLDQQDKGNILGF